MPLRLSRSNSKTPWHWSSACVLADGRRLQTPGATWLGRVVHSCIRSWCAKSVVSRLTAQHAAFTSSNNQRSIHRGIQKGTGGRVLKRMSQISHATQQGPKASTAQSCGVAAKQCSIMKQGKHRKCCDPQPCYAESHRINQTSNLQQKICLYSKT